MRRAPRKADAWGRLGLALYANNYFVEAADCFACAERLDGSNPRWPFFAMEIARRRGDDAELIAKARRAAELSDRPPADVLVRLAEALAAAGRYDEAEQQFRAVLAAHGYTIDPATSEISQLKPYVGAFSARAAQIRRNVDRYEAELIRRAGLAYTEMTAMGFGLPVVEARLRYRQPARYDDLLCIDCRVGKLLRASVGSEIHSPSC